MGNRAQSSVYSRSYNSFSGVDIKAVFGNKVIAELQAISYSITREKAPVYTMGSADARSFSRGKRGIAGTLIFIMFDRHPVLSALGGPQGLKFQSDIDDIRPGFGLGATGLSNLPKPVQQSESDIPVGGAGAVDASNIAADQSIASPWYVDQLPPFDVTLAAANEYGALAVMRIFGVELLNEGYGVSIDDIVSETQYTYVARTIIPWTSVPSPNLETLAGQGGQG